MREIALATSHARLRMEGVTGHRAHLPDASARLGATAGPHLANPMDPEGLARAGTVGPADSAEPAGSAGVVSSLGSNWA